MAKRNLLLVKKLNFLSLVDRPANQHSHAVITKRGAVENLREKFPLIVKRFTDTVNALRAGDLTPEQIAKDAQSFREVAAVDELWRINGALQSSVASILADSDKTAEQKQQLLDVSLSEFRDAVLALNVQDDAFDAIEEAGESGEPVTKDTQSGGEPSDRPQPPAAAPSAGEPGDSQPAEGTTMKRITKSFTDLAAAQAHIGELTTELTTLDSQMETLQKSVSDLQAKVDAAEAEKDPIAVITKGMPPAAAAAYKQQAERIQKMEEREADRARDERVTKMAGDGSELTADETSALRTVLKALDVSNLPEADRTKAEAFLGTVFKQYNALADELEGMDLGIVKSATGGDEDDAEVAVQKRADELQKADPKLTREQAIAKAYTEDPELYDAAASAEPNVQ